MNPQDSNRMNEAMKKVLRGEADRMVEKAFNELFSGLLSLPEKDLDASLATLSLVELKDLLDVLPNEMKPLLEDKLKEQMEQRLLGVQQLAQTSIISLRRKQGQCINCGLALRFWSRLFSGGRHSGCTEFRP